MTSISAWFTHYLYVVLIRDHIYIALFSYHTYVQKYLFYNDPENNILKRAIIEHAQINIPYNILKCINAPFHLCQCIHACTLFMQEVFTRILYNSQHLYYCTLSIVHGSQKHLFLDLSFFSQINVGAWLRTCGHYKINVQARLIHKLCPFISERQCVSHNKSYYFNI